MLTGGWASPSSLVQVSLGFPFGLCCCAQRSGHGYSCGVRLEWGGFCLSVFCLTRLSASLPFGWPERAASVGVILSVPIGICSLLVSLAPSLEYVRQNFNSENSLFCYWVLSSQPVYLCSTFQSLSVSILVLMFRDSSWT